ncbi:MAG: restriction endonuclease subunit S [Planctomycetota bacterium]
MQTVTLADVCSIEARLVDPKLDEHADRVHIGGANIISSSGQLANLQTAREEGLKSPKFYFDPEDVLYSKIRPYLRKVTWPQTAGLCSADIYPLRPGKRIRHRYLQYLLLSDQFTSYAVRVSNRAGMPKVNREQLFAFEFELPDLDEQAKHIALLDKVFEGIAELERLAELRSRELWSLKRSLVFGASPDDRTWEPVGEHVEWIRSMERVAPTATYGFAGVKSFGGGVFRSGSRQGDEFGYKSVHRLEAGEFIYPKLMAWEGALGLVPQAFGGLVVSPEFVVFRPNSGALAAEVLDTYFRSPTSWERVKAASTGTNRRRRRLHPRAFLTLEVPIPPKDSQAMLRKVYEQESRIQRDSSLDPDKLATLRSSALAKVFSGADALGSVATGRSQAD